MSSILVRLRQPKYLVLLICLSLIALNIFLVHGYRNYDSDDVSWQVLLSSWTPFNHHQIYLGSKDNFIINLPFILIAKLFLGNTTRALLLSSTLMIIFNFILFYNSAIYFIKKLKVKLNFINLSPFIWLSSFGFWLLSLYFNTVWRDFEIGVSFYYFMLASRYYCNELSSTKKSKLKFISLTVITSLFSFSDPYFIVFTLMPIVLYYFINFILKATTLKKFLVIISLFISNLILTIIYAYLISFIGIHQANSKLYFFGLKDLPLALKTSILEIGQIFNANNTIFGLSNLLLLLILAVYLIYLVYSLKQPKKALKSWLTYFVFIIAMVYGATTLLNSGTIYAYRYFIIVVYLAVILLACLLTSLGTKLKYLLFFIILASIGLNLTNSIDSYKIQLTSRIKPNQSNNSLITTLNEYNLKKGYADYWNSNINNFLDSKLDILPISCHDNSTQPLLLLTDSSLYLKPTKQTFLIDSPNSNPALCSFNSIIQQFGKPTFTINQAVDQILVFDYDIYSKMPAIKN